jgi:hypothetical protein
MAKSVQSNHTKILFAAVVAATAFVGAGNARADDTQGYATVSISGSTALKNWFLSGGSTLLTPGQSFTIGGVATSNSTLGTATYSSTPITVTAPSTPTADYELAPNTYQTATSNYTNSADLLRLEYHASGSVEGIQDLLNSQVGVGAPSPLNSSDPVYINPTGGSATASANNKVTATNTSAGGWAFGQQAPVTMAVADVNAVQGFAISGGTPNVHATAGSPGYGYGNPALSSNLTFSQTLVTASNGTPGIRAALVDSSALSLSNTTKFGTGAWNTATFANVQSTPFAATATLFAANPGTGLTQINRTDAQWLETTSRLQNGASFNFTSRDVNSGTRNMSSTITGLDPSWAVGKNDAGNGYLSTGGTSQISLNPAGVTFSNKTSGGSQLLPTLEVNRLAVGTIGISDAIGSVNASGANGANPLVSLAYSDSTDGSAPYVQATTANITNGSYVLWQTENFVTLKNPAGYNAANGTWASQTDAQTGILGDTVGATAAFRGNILYASNNEPNTLGINNPGDALIANSLLPLEYMQFQKTMDGVGNTTYSSTGATWVGPAGDAALNANFGSNFNTVNTATTGVGSIYGVNGKSVYTTPSQGNILITSTNYLFGNFNQNGTRDLSAVESALAALKAYNAAFSPDAAYNTGAANSSTFSYTGVNGVPHTISKGDAIVMGDTLSRGTFDGMDLYNLAHGAALSDASGAGFTNGTLTIASGATLGDQLRNGVLRKNAALDYLQANTVAGDPIRVSASQNITNDPTGINAFNKFDVNHDGLITRSDALTVDALLGKDYTNLNDQLGVTLKDNNGNQQDIADAVFTDDHTTVSRSDLDMITSDLMAAGSLTLGDANMDGHVDLTDLSLVLNNFGSSNDHWTAGNFDGAATIDLTDLSDVLNNFGTTTSGVSVAGGAVAAAPEPASLGLLGIAGVLVLNRRRRSC